MQNAAIDAIVDSARAPDSGRMGDGKVIVTHVADVVRVMSDERAIHQSEESPRSTIQKKGASWAPFLGAGRGPKRRKSDVRNQLSVPTHYNLGGPRRIRFRVSGIDPSQGVPRLCIHHVTPASA